MAAGVEIHLGRFFLGISDRDSPSQPVCPRPPACLQFHLRVPNLFEAPLALVDQLVQDPLAFHPVRIASSIGVLEVGL